VRQQFAEPGARAAVLRNLKGEPTMGIDDWFPDMPVSLWPPRTLSGSCSPWRWLSSGL
jgi:hypothetical protein